MKDNLAQVGRLVTQSVSLCPNTPGHQCHCQPQEGNFCPYGWIDVDDYVRDLPLGRWLRVQFWRLVWKWRLSR